ncbi:MAG: hypothetical protein NT141_04090 [candidate division WWE3 bacterium]|nr:hypothetical protein [candidate division WWE3 bacterium]
MNVQSPDPKILMEDGWKARENYEFKQSEKLLTVAKSLFEKQKDWQNVTECLNHLAYLRQMQAFDLLVQGRKFAAESLTVARKESVDQALPNRANQTILRWLGEFEQADEFAKVLVNSINTNSAARAEARGSLALILMRTGKINEAKNEIELAFRELDEGWEKERMPHKMIWKTKLLIIASLIDYNLGNKKDAKIRAAKALALSKEHNLKMRLAEAEELLKLFS